MLDRPEGRVQTISSILGEPQIFAKLNARASRCDVFTLPYEHLSVSHEGYLRIGDYRFAPLTRDKVDELGTVLILGHRRQSAATAPCALKPYLRGYR